MLKKYVLSLHDATATVEIGVLKRSSMFQMNATNSVTHAEVHLP
jgi:hypothetical protein